jgi:hypothetical protein
MNPIPGECRKQTPSVAGPGPADRRRETCPYCGGRNLHEVECTGGPHHARLGCSDCHRHIRFLPAPWTQHRGRTVGDLARRPAGPDYLAWAAANLEGNAATAARIVPRAGGWPAARGEGNDR